MFQDGVHLIVFEGNRLGPLVGGIVLGGDEPGYARRVADDIPAFIVHIHLHQDIARKQLFRFRLALPVLERHFGLGGNDDLDDAVLNIQVFPAGIQVLFDPILLPGIGMQDVPAQVFPGFREVIYLGGHQLSCPT